MNERRIVPTVEVSGFRDRVALWRLSAVGRYLYDTMNGDAESERDRPDPLPTLAMEKVREAQVAIDEAIRLGQRATRATIGGELELSEEWKHLRPSSDASSRTEAP